MRGRGLLIAAAVLQLVGAALFLFTAVAQIAIGSVIARGDRPPLVLGAAAFGGAIAIAYVVVSIALLRGRRWAWIASLALDALSALSFVALPILGRVGLGELIILVAILGAPLFVTIGLLIGGRHAVSSTETAAPPPATQSGG